MTNQHNLRNYLLAAALVLSPAVASAQTEAPANDRRVYAEVTLGAGQTLLFGDIKDKLRQAYGSDFEPGIVGNIGIGFLYAPSTWNGLGIGARIKGSGSGPQKDDDSPSEYFFNYYSLGAQAKWHFVTKEFNRGLYARAGIGFGQLTTKRQFNDADNTYVHQFAIGQTFSAGLGYAWPWGRNSIGVETEFEYSSRNGTISGQKDSQTFTSGQIGLQAVYSF